MSVNRLFLAFSEYPRTGEFLRSAALLEAWSTTTTFQGNGVLGSPHGEASQVQYIDRPQSMRCETEKYETKAMIRLWLLGPGGRMLPGTAAGLQLPATQFWHLVITSLFPFHSFYLQWLVTYHIAFPHLDPCLCVPLRYQSHRRSKPKGSKRSRWQFTTKFLACSH